MPRPANDLPLEYVSLANRWTTKDEMDFLAQHVEEYLGLLAKKKRGHSVGVFLAATTSQFLERFYSDLFNVPEKDLTDDKGQPTEVGAKINFWHQRIKDWYHNNSDLVTWDEGRKQTIKRRAISGTSFTKSVISKATMQMKVANGARHLRPNEIYQKRYPHRIEYTIRMHIQAKVYDWLRIRRDIENKPGFNGTPASLPSTLPDPSECQIADEGFDPELFGDITVDDKELASYKSYKGLQLGLRSLVSRKMLAIESDEIKKEIEDAVEQSKESVKKAKEEANQPNAPLVFPSPEECYTNIRRCQELLKHVGAQVEKATGWTVHIHVGGPRPDQDGQLDIVEIQSGLRLYNGLRFSEFYPQYRESVEKPLYKYLSAIYPEDVRKQHVIGYRVDRDPNSTFQIVGSESSQQHDNEQGEGGLGQSGHESEPESAGYESEDNQFDLLGVNKQINEEGVDEGQEHLGTAFAGMQDSLGSEPVNDYSSSSEMDFSSNKDLNALLDSFPYDMFPVSDPLYRMPSEDLEEWTVNFLKDYDGNGHANTSLNDQAGPTIQNINLSNLPATSSTQHLTDFQSLPHMFPQFAPPIERQCQQESSADNHCQQQLYSAQPWNETPDQDQTLTNQSAHQIGIPSNYRLQAMPSPTSASQQQVSPQKSHPSVSNPLDDGNGQDRTIDTFAQNTALHSTETQANVAPFPLARAHIWPVMHPLQGSTAATQIGAPKGKGKVKEANKSTKSQASTSAAGTTSRKGKSTDLGSHTASFENPTTSVAAPSMEGPQRASSRKRKPSEKLRENQGNNSKRGRRK